MKFGVEFCRPHSRRRAAGPGGFAYNTYRVSQVYSVEDLLDLSLDPIGYHREGTGMGPGPVSGTFFGPALPHCLENVPDGPAGSGPIPNVNGRNAGGGRSRFGQPGYHIHSGTRCEYANSRPRWFIASRLIFHRHHSYTIPYPCMYNAVQLVIVPFPVLLLLFFQIRLSFTFNSSFCMLIILIDFVTMIHCRIYSGCLSTAYLHCTDDNCWSAGGPTRF